MSYSGKIRLMLALLGASLLLTAIIVRSTYTSAVNLSQTARMLEDNLQKKEDYIIKALGAPGGINRFKGLANNYENGLKCLQEFTTGRNIKVVTVKDGILKYWSDITFIPENPSLIKEGYSFIKEPNGYYEAIKKNDGNFSVIFFIPVKVNFVVQNQYLRNGFSKDLLKDNNIDIADFTDKNTYAIHSITDTYLFSVKVLDNEVNYRFFYFELVIWVLTFIVICTLVQNICNYLANTGRLLLSFVFLTLFIVGIRFINLQYNWPNFTYKLDIFNPHLYSSGKVFPSLGDLCINILMCSWLTAFIYRQRFKLLKYLPGKTGAYPLVTGCTLILIVVSTVLLNVFYGLVVKSEINFDVNNVLSLSVYSLCGILMLCFSFFIFYLLAEVFLTVCNRLHIPARHQLLILIAGVLLATCYYSILRHELIVFYILWSFLVMIRGYAYYYKNGKTTTFMFAGVLLVCSVISSTNLNHFESIKEKQFRKELVKKLENPTDATADYLFKKIEKQIVKDPFIIRYFNDTIHNTDYLQNRFQKLYFDGYLSKYDFKIHEFNAAGQSVSADKNYQLDVFKDMVLYSSLKVSNYFYRENESFGFQNYFAILPVIDKDKTLGSIVIELKSKALQTSNYFPELLIDGQSKDEDNFKNYSYAFYSDNKLLAQSGDYVYKLVRNKNIIYKPKTFVFKSLAVENPLWYQPFTSYSHLIYKPTERNLIVISKEENTVFYNITSITFFFVILLAFSVFVIAGSWAWLRIKILTITNNKIKWGLKITLDKILYKTRIQFSMVFAVVVTLVLVGIITYISISSQYQMQQDKMIRDKLTKITDAFENGLFDKYMVNINEQSQIKFDALAASYSSDLVLFDSHGRLLITTQPRIYEYGLIAKRMNARAFITLHNGQRSEYVNDEMIGGLSYKTVYAPIRNTKGETIAFLQLPYFSNEADYKERIGSLLNIMINIYALIFISIGLFAVIIARQITNPLSFIQQSLSKTIYGKKNKPIKWDRDDEIGALVKEYNNMIAALEASAVRLAQSERESAWREMAKQVAHEIKNPLTPLKLGLQLLEKSWREKDPKFDQKFERFSKSFVEQIESLSQIASEFSAFAKMPDTRMERFNVFEVISQAVVIFKQMDNFAITYNAPKIPFYVNADKDQLLRCFNNLLKNAIEATPPDRFGQLEIDHQITGKNILLTVKDNGNGIPQNMREKIFEPNFTTKSSGTGLGLAFVKNSIENAGGKVWFETEAGKGTTFFLSLPAAV
ncbi:HAMP domain-containing sensor histidine kinase [Mucilaginibacter sp. UR6-11]|uniref:sensor histidine kinase n=1 Tax=Mucilaginibacter sp. UR6-11 TaxID=1435644 RepID=UPI001E54FF7C|nr:HAMP domain-containing sensor histidine kinase [Mucilaginibacter sp. UR6-11]MCC8425635.1 HAMP domain-containing histidine kinase [Mucilaginibacter sp. UR6-11]